MLSAAENLLPAFRARIIRLHLIMVTLFVLGVYLDRDIWPLLTYTLNPADKEQGRLLWIKVAMAVLAGAIIPAIEPRLYIPTNSLVSRGDLPFIVSRLTSSLNIATR